MKSAYLVVQGYANFCKIVSMVIIHVPRFRIRLETMSRIKFSENFYTLVLDSESRDVSNCHPY